MRELNDTRTLSVASRDARNHTLSLYAHLTPEQMRLPYRRGVKAPLRELAHVGRFQEFWCLCYRDNNEPLPSCLSNRDPTLNSATTPHCERRNSPQLTPGTADDFLRKASDDTPDALERSDEDRRYFSKLALFHEDRHAEALLMTLGYPVPAQQRPARPQPAPILAAPEIRFTGGEFDMGSRAGANFVFDKEKWRTRSGRHRLHSPRNWNPSASFSPLANPVDT